MNHDEWLKTVPHDITRDSLWKVEVYRLALFAADIGWHDVTKLMRDKRTMDLSDQLYRALGSVAANIAEGYSRGTGKDRARFYEYGLGSARESRGWYWNGRHVLAEPVVEHRLRLMTQIIRLLLTMIPEQRGAILKEGNYSGDRRFLSFGVESLRFGVWSCFPFNAKLQTPNFQRQTPNQRKMT